MTQSGLILGIIIAIMVGIFFGLAIWNSDLKVKQKILWQIVIFTFFFLLVGFGRSFEEKNFNNGVCPNCGTQYKAITHTRNSTYYECPNCYFGTWN